MTKVKKSALGRGLGALLASSETDITSKYEENKFSEAVGSIALIGIDRIETNPFQPRQHFDEQSLKELTESIMEHGIIQPLTVRKVGNDKFQLISGERRFRASQFAGLKEIPVYIRIANDQSMLEMALIENIQRQDLDAIEVAIGYKRLIEECDLTQEQLSERVGKERSTVTNYLRLLKLPIEIQKGIRDRKISMGHARALVGMESDERRLEVYRAILENDLSVRQVESLSKGQKEFAITRVHRDLSFDDKKFRSDLEVKFRTKISLTKDNKGAGKLVFMFKDEEEFEKIKNILS
jgi:ParB family transcriptional regulator, chromosome partitioning protein